MSDSMDKVKQAVEKAGDELSEVRDKIVEGAAKNPKRFVNLMAAVILFLLVLIGLAYCSKAGATGLHVKPPVVAPPPSSPPGNPSQPAAKGGGGSFLSKGGWAMIGVMVYFGLVIYEREKWCAEDDRKPPADRRCYRPLRDGMP
jgi:hypothetical protein